MRHIWAVVVLPATLKGALNVATDKALDLIYGRWRSQILYAGAELGIFDHVASEIAKSSEAVADRTWCRPDAPLPSDARARVTWSSC